MRENEYRRLCLRLGAVLICNFVLISVLAPILLIVIQMIPLGSSRADNLLYQLAYIVIYAASFLLPVGLYFLLARGEDGGSIVGAPALPGRCVPLILATLGVIVPASYLNQWFVYLLEQIGIPGLPLDTMIYFYYPEDAVLFHITLVLVPAFCEELLFRGVILSRLLPYGRTSAILISAVTFGLMHGNHEQLFYATIAGVMLGWCYTETGSIWPGVIAHMLNNLCGFLAQYWYEWTGYEEELLYNLLLTLPLLAAGAVSMVWLLIHRAPKADRPPRALCLGWTQTPTEGGRTLPLADAIGLFVRQPIVIVYLVLCVGSIVLVMLLGAVQALLPAGYGAAWGGAFG